MALPRVNVPQYELELPSTKEKITYRPFLVKEEKILLLALEEGDDESIARALKQIVHNCTYEKMEIEKLPLFDLEYVFLRVRAKSVGEVAELKLLCEDDGETYADVSIPLEEIEVAFTEGHTPEIKMDDNIMVKMRYPTYEMLGQDPGAMTVEKTFELVGKCIDKVFDGETVHERADFNDKDLAEFLDSLNSKQFKDIQTFFETMPKLSYEVKFKNPKTKKNNKVTLEGLQSFFV